MVIIIDKDKLDIKKTKKILCLSYCNYRPDLKFDFPSGAIEINTFQASKKYFNSIENFYLHVYVLPYINYLEYDLPKHVFDLELCFDQLDKEKFLYYCQGYLDSFKGLSEDNLWKCELSIQDFITGFKLNTAGSELVLVGESKRDYFSFVYQSID